MALNITLNSQTTPNSPVIDWLMTEVMKKRNDNISRIQCSNILYFASHLLTIFSSLGFYQSMHWTGKVNINFIFVVTNGIRKLYSISWIPLFPVFLLISILTGSLFVLSLSLPLSLPFSLTLVSLLSSSNQIIDNLIWLWLIYEILILIDHTSSNKFIIQIVSIYTDKYFWSK